MSNSEDQSPSDDFFNDLSQQLPPQQDESGERRESQDDGNGQVPKPKRIACVLCRKRKLRCDGNKPSCGTCTRLQHDCSYDEVRRKSGPKRGYVKALEARLAQVEVMLKTQDDRPPSKSNEASDGELAYGAQNNGMVPDFQDIVVGTSNVDMLPHIERTVNQHDYPTQSQFPHTTLGANSNGNVNMPTEDFSWEMIGLGLDEPLPNQDVINELNKAYFEKIHPSLPFIHRPRYYAAMNLAPHMRPPVCLRYAMWCNAASVTDKFEALQEHFYHRARKYIQQDEMKGHGEGMITTAHCQTWALLATYEFKLMYFPRAWMSSGRATRLAQMMGLHRLDGAGLDVKQCLPPSRDWTEREERRRTFWMCFCIDRYSSIGTGWPMTVDEKDISTVLPASEEAFELGKPGTTMTLSEAFDVAGVPTLTPYGGVILLATLFGRNLLHLHRPGPDDKDNDLNGEFWQRHRRIDAILLNTALALPDTLRLPSGLNEANIVFMNMNLHTSTICLHQAAIFKADRFSMPARISAESKVRCITAAAEIASIMRQISHLDLSAMNPFISFCLYVAARVFVQYLKSRPKDAQVRASLQFLLSAMHAIKRKNPLTESFLVQLDVDLEGSGLEDTRTLRAAAPKSNVPFRSTGCAFDLGVANPADSRAPTYGDQGLAMYNHPNAETVPIEPPAMAEAENFNLQAADLADFILDSPKFDLPNRQRTPGSMPGSGPGTFRSPQSGNPEMDVSEDGSGDQHTPSSASQSQQRHSSHTSNTGYSPQHQSQPQAGFGQKQSIENSEGTFPHGMVSMFDTNFDMHNFPTSTADAQQSGFVLPQDWSVGNGTGFTPGATGMTPGNNVNDLISMTDADWNQMLGEGGFMSWDSNMNEDANLQALLNGKKSS